jgi:hypothetical protein
MVYALCTPDLIIIAEICFGKVRQPCRNMRGEGNELSELKQRTQFTGAMFHHTKNTFNFPVTKWL